MITLRIYDYFFQKGTPPCVIRLMTSISIFLENYLSDVLTGQMYADVDTVSIEKYLAEMKDSTTGKELLSQANCADLLSDEAKEIIDERLQKSNCDTHELIIRLRYCLQMTLKRDFDIPEELVMYILRYINGAIWYVKHKNNSIIDIAKGWIEENPEEYQKMCDELLGGSKDTQ